MCKELGFGSMNMRDSLLLMKEEGTTIGKLVKSCLDSGGDIPASVVLDVLVAHIHAYT